MAKAMDSNKTHLALQVVKFKRHGKIQWDTIKPICEIGKKAFRAAGRLSETASQRFWRERGGESVEKELNGITPF